MMNVKNDLRKLGIVSVSALMLLGVGAGMSASHTPVHAMPSVQYMLTHNAAEDQAEKEEIAGGKRNGVIYNKNGSVNDEATMRNQDRMFHPHAIQPSQPSDSNVDVPSRDIPHTKRQAKNVKKNVNAQVNHVKRAKKHAHKRAKKQSLAVEIKDLKTEVQKLQHEINKVIRR